MLVEINNFVNWVRQRNPEARTWKDYKYDLMTFNAFLEGFTIFEVSYREIDSFIIHQKNQGFTNATINRRLASITSFFLFLSTEYPEIECPVMSHRHQLRKHQRLPKPVQRVDVEAFFAAIESSAPYATRLDPRPRDRAIFTLMLRCGLRISEVANLLLDSLFLDEPKPRMIVDGKGSIERMVFISPHALSTLNDYLSVRSLVLDEHVFLSYQFKGLSSTAIHYRLALYRKMANVSFSSHNLRHTFANDLLNADMPVTSIQKLLGHRWLETTQNYVQANDKLVAKDFYDACERMEEWK